MAQDHDQATEFAALWAREARARRREEQWGRRIRIASILVPGAIILGLLLTMATGTTLEAQDELARLVAAFD